MRSLIWTWCSMNSWMKRSTLLQTFWRKKGIALAGATIWYVPHGIDCPDSLSWIFMSLLRVIIGAMRLPSRRSFQQRSLTESLNFWMALARARVKTWKGMLHGVWNLKNWRLNLEPKRAELWMKSAFVWITGATPPQPHPSALSIQSDSMLKRLATESKRHFVPFFRTPWPKDIWLWNDGLDGFNKRTYGIYISRKYSWSKGGQAVYARRHGYVWVHPLYWATGHADLRELWEAWWFEAMWEVQKQIVLQ